MTTTIGKKVDEAAAKQASHTPGPWSLTSVSNGGFNVWSSLGPAWIICSRGDMPHRAEESEANARLIAAAPDMLAALNAMCGYLLNAQIDLETDTKKSTTIATLQGGLKIARAAISRAEGRT